MPISKQFNRIRIQLKKHFKAKKNRRRAIYIAGAVVIFLLIFSLIGVSSQASQEKDRLKSNLILKQRSLETLKQTLNKTQVQSAQQIQARDQALQDTQKQIESLNKQLQAKAAKRSVMSRAVAYVAPQTASAAPIGQTGCGDNEYAHYIYMHESGCNPASVNSLGCRGIGQACPGSKLPCGADYACQNAYFTNYANQVYGGWAGAYNHWLTSHWW